MSFRSLTLTVALLASSAIVDAKSPNVLFLAVDDMKDWVTCLNGYEGTVHTPNIDMLASRGMLFTNAHCVSPKCAPSRAAIMTGLRPSTTGLYDNSHWWLPNLPDVVTLPVHFRRYGYVAVGAGKIFHHTAGNHPPNQWDEYLRLPFRNDPWFRASKLNYPWSEASPRPEGFPFSGIPRLGHENDWGSLDIDDEEYEDFRSASYAVEFLRQPRIQPFFLACGIFRPHLPWYIPKEYFDAYSLQDIRLPNVLDKDLDDVPQLGRKLARSRETDFLKIREGRKWKQAIQAYLASITYADRQIGRVLDALRASPHSDNTVVVLWSDHGWHLGEKGHWHKSTLWEEATRVPFIVDAPGFEPGICAAPVSLIDIYPTLNELCGVPSKARLDGVSLVPLLSEPLTRWERPAVTEFRRGNAAVRSSRYRYIRYQDGAEELYDHVTDPYEWKNLAKDRSLAGAISELSKWLPRDWAKPAETKSAFDFDHRDFVWTHKVSGKKTHGK